MGSASSRAQAGPSSSAISADNSRGASAAALELSAALSGTLNEIDLDGEYQIPDVRQVFSSQAEAQLVSAAWKCARGTYNLGNTIEDTAYCTFRRDHALDHSLTGNVKALTTTVIEPVGEGGDNMLPVLVVAIRGSASKMDHIVNANARPKGIEGFIHPDILNQPAFKAHSGFLNSAWALAAIVSQRIKNYIQNTQSQGGRKPHVLFTGHSAGGAVASLFYLHYISNQEFSDSTRFSCVTFGAPPCVTAPADLSLYQPSGTTLCLNIINEFDVVSRVDRPYILSLVELVRSTLGLPPHSPTADTDMDEIPLEVTSGGASEDISDISSFSGEFEKDFVAADPDFWRNPRPFYHHVGPRVILVMRLEGGQMSLRAVEVPPLEFRRLLFCRIAVHLKACYGDRVEMLESGRFNRKTGWE
ncbi:hypothetical protein ACJZ2D_000161 [Fusarium nematophilum]